MIPLLRRTCPQHARGALGRIRVARRSFGFSRVAEESALDGDGEQPRARAALRPRSFATARRAPAPRRPFPGDRWRSGTVAHEATAQSPESASRRRRARPRTAKGVASRRPALSIARRGFGRTMRADAIELFHAEADRIEHHVAARADRVDRLQGEVLAKRAQLGRWGVRSQRDVRRWGAAGRRAGRGRPRARICLAWWERWSSRARSMRETRRARARRRASSGNVVAAESAPTSAPSRAAVSAFKSPRRVSKSSPYAASRVETTSWTRSSISCRADAPKVGLISGNTRGAAAGFELPAGRPRRRTGFRLRRPAAIRGAASPAGRALGRSRLLTGCGGIEQLVVGVVFQTKYDKRVASSNGSRMRRVGSIESG